MHFKHAQINAVRFWLSCPCRIICLTLKGLATSEPSLHQFDLPKGHHGNNFRHFFLLWDIGFTHPTLKNPVFEGLNMEPSATIFQIFFAIPYFIVACVILKSQRFLCTPSYLCDKQLHFLEKLLTQFLSSLKRDYRDVCRERTRYICLIRIPTLQLIIADICPQN